MDHPAQPEKKCGSDPKPTEWGEEAKTKRKTKNCSVICDDDDDVGSSKLGMNNTKPIAEFQVRNGKESLLQLGAVDKTIGELRKSGVAL